MLLCWNTTSKQISRVNFSDAAICVLLFNRDDDFSLSLFLEFGYLLVFTFFWFLVIIVILQQGLLEFWGCEHAGRLLGNRRVFLIFFTVLDIASHRTIWIFKWASFIAKLTTFKLTDVSNFWQPQTEIGSNLKSTNHRVTIQICNFNG